MADVTSVSVGDGLLGRLVLFPFILANYDGEIKFDARAVDVDWYVWEFRGVLLCFRRDVFRSIRE